MSNRYRAARTPLFAALKKALTKAAYTEDKRVTSETSGWTRRHFLQTAAVGTAATWAGLPLLTTAAAVPKIVVVGAGVAGLNAAYQLKKAGLYAEVYEAGGRIGGRVFTLKDTVGPGLTSNLGGSFIDSIHREMLTLTKELKLKLLDYEDDEELAGIVNLFGGQQYTDEQVVKALLPFLPRIGEDYRKSQNNPEEAARLDNLSITQYMEGIGIEGWLRDYLDVQFTMEMGLECEEQSAFTFITQLMPNTSYEMMMFDLHDERYLLKGGAQQLPDALAAQVSDQIHLYHTLEAIHSAGSGFILNFLGSNGATKEIKADIVILAIPFSVLRQVEMRVALPPLKKQAIAELGYGTHAKIIAGFQEKLWRKQGYYGDVVTDKSFQSVWDSTAFQPGHTGGLTFFFGGRAGIELIERFTPTMEPMLSDLEPIFPGLSKVYNGRYMFWSWPKFGLSRGSYSCHKPGQLTTFVPEIGKPVGNLFFAGEHCSTNFNGFMEGAAETGHQVANRIVALVTKN